MTLNFNWEAEETLLLVSLYFFGGGGGVPALCVKCVISSTSPAVNSQDAGDGAYGLSYLSVKTRTTNHLQMSLQRQHILLNCFKTLSVGPIWGSNPRPPARQSGALPTDLTKSDCSYWHEQVAI